MDRHNVYRKAAETDISAFSSGANRFLRSAAQQNATSPSNLVHEKHYAVPVVDRTNLDYAADHGRFQVNIPGSVDITHEASITMGDLPSLVSIAGDLKAPLSFFTELPPGKTLSVNGKLVVVLDGPMDKASQEAVIRKLETMNGLDARNVSIETCSKTASVTVKGGIRKLLRALWQ